MSLWSRLTFAPLIALAIVTIILTFDFWSSFGGHFALAFQIIGVCFVLIELTGLVIYADLRARNETVKSRWWVLAFVGVVLVNLFADYGAVVTRTAADANDRARARVQYEAALTNESEAGVAIERLERQLEDLDRNQPLDSLRAEHAALERRVAWYAGREREPPRRLAAELTRAESALAMAEALEAATARRDQARATIVGFGAPPEREHPQFEAIAAMLTSLGLTVSAGTVRVWLALPIAVVLKLLQLLGFWVLSAQARPSHQSAEIETGLDVREPSPKPLPAMQRKAEQGEGHTGAAELQAALGAFEALSRDRKRG